MQTSIFGAEKRRTFEGKGNCFKCFFWDVDVDNSKTISDTNFHQPRMYTSLLNRKLEVLECGSLPKNICNDRVNHKSRFVLPFVL